MIVTVIFACAVGVQMVISLVEGMAVGMVWPLLREMLVDAAIASLVLGGLVYQIARLGRFSRKSDAVHQAEDLSSLHAPDACPGPLPVLIPSYCEDVDVVRQTALCAVLQDYPDRRVVICVDDPPHSADESARLALAAVRALPGEIAAWLSEPAGHAAAAERSFHHRQYFEPTLKMNGEARVLAFEFRRAARWLEEQGGREAAGTPTERLFVQVVFTDRAASCRAIADRLRARASADALNDAEVAMAYAELGSMFRGEVSTFERKRYVNTSLEPNKAMNLNSYIALLGNTCGEVRKADGLHLKPLSPIGTAGTPAPALQPLVVPDATWLLTVDADSLLVHDYAARMVRLLRQPEHARTAISQTPYSAVPELTGRLERTAGHTTKRHHRVGHGRKGANGGSQCGRGPPRRPWPIERSALLSGTCAASYHGGRGVGNTKGTETHTDKDDVIRRKRCEQAAAGATRP